MCQRPLRQRAGEGAIAAWARCAAGLRDQAGRGSVLVAALIVVYGLATLGQQNGVPHGFWGAGQKGAALLVALGVLAGIGSFVVTFNVKGLLDRAETDGKLVTPCRDIAWLVENNTKIARGAVGVHIWEIAGPVFARRLRRRAMFRTRAGTHTPVLWTRGKGAIGQCWVSGEKDQLTDLAQMQASATTEDRFCALEPHERFNMTWSEFQAGKQYNLIWVTKLYRGQGDAPKLKGLLSVDVEGIGHADELAQALTTHKTAVRALLDLCEQLLA